MILQKFVGAGVSAAANVAWHAFQAFNRLTPEGKVHPKWSPEPLLKSRERSFPTLGIPRETDSLCPGCVKEVREKVLSGEMDWRALVDGRPGEIRARIVERDGGVYMEKECERHGAFRDIMSIDAAFTRRMEKLYPGRDFRMAPDPAHNHGSSTVRYGRGAVLTIDLTNRCNMMCNPCFMDANQVGYVHELTWEEIKRILDDSIQVKPRRQMSVQFSGGEPTLSPHFLDAVAYARKVGYLSVQAATNGIRFAQDLEFAKAAHRAGLRLVYLQFDGVTNEANSHRGVANFFDVKKRAIENLNAAGVDVTLVVTIVNSINNDQVGPIVRMAAENIDKINAVSFQPVSFAGRDEDAGDEQRARWRYTLSHLAHDLKRQLGVTEPMRDWFPLSASGPFSDLRDLIDGGHTEWGNLKCGCHPNCGVGTMLLVNERTHQIISFPQLLNVERIFEDMRIVNDSARSRALTMIQTVLSVLRNYRTKEALPGLGLWDVVKIIDGHNGRRLGLADKNRYEWRVLLVAGMWFQDLFNYDFRRTEVCIIPYGTQLGEISFCAYNTGIGWRQIIEKMFQVGSVKEWYARNGRHTVYGGGRRIPLPVLGRDGPTRAPLRPAETAGAPLPGQDAEEVAAGRDGRGNGNGNGAEHAAAEGDGNGHQERAAARPPGTGATASPDRKPAAPAS